MSDFHTRSREEDRARSVAELDRTSRNLELKRPGGVEISIHRNRLGVTASIFSVRCRGHVVTTRMLMYVSGEVFECRLEHQPAGKAYPLSLETWGLWIGSTRCHLKDQAEHDKVKAFIWQVAS